MATWKKIIVSGSQAELAGVTGSFTGSFIGDGSALTGVSGEFPSTFKSGISYDATKFFVNDGASKFVSGSQVAAYVFDAASDAGDATIGADGGITINADSVENSMLANMTRGTVKVGGTANAPTDLDAKTDGQILVGDGTDINSVAISGDISLANNGAVTIANDAVETAMIAHSLGTLGTHAFTGSFTGSFSGTTNLPDLTDGNGIADFTYDGSSAASVALDLDGSTLTVGASGVKISDGGVDTDQLANDAVTNAKLANITRGSIKVGGASNAPTDLDAKTDGQILVGDGTDINSVAVSGDVTLANDGAVTIANDAVNNNKLANIARGSVKVGGSGNAPTDLDAKTSGQILVGDGTDIVSVAVSGDVSLAANGAITIANDAVETAMIAHSLGTLGTHQFTGSFSGSYTGDGSGLTGVTGEVNIDALDALGGTGLHQTQDHFIFSDNGTEKKITFSNLQDAVFADVSGDATIAAGGALTIAADSVENSMLANMTRGTVKVGGGSNAPTDLDAKTDGQILVGDGTDINSVAISGDISLANNGAVTIASNAVEGSMLNSNVAGSGLDYTSNELRVDVSDFMTNGANNRVLTATGTDGQNAEANLTFDGSTLALSGAMTISTNLTVSGNLTVTGDTIENQVTNLNVEDKFILLNSGSSTATDESGIIFGGANGSQGTGTALIWNGDYNSNDGRLAIANTVASDASTATVSYYIGGVFDGTANDAATAQADHRGNIRVDSSDDIYIYV